MASAAQRVTYPVKVILQFIIKGIPDRKLTPRLILSLIEGGYVDVYRLERRVEDLP